jgi:16S rRNA (guanine966-N2)-methyltransferase
MREAIFSSLSPRVEGSRVVDLFAGTGAYGLEAISRGAVKATFYETNREALACMKQNCQAVLKSCGLENNAAYILARDVYAADTVVEKAELIFIDPPYDEIENRLEQILRKADQHATEDACLIFEFPGNLELISESWQITRRFGKLNRDAPNAAILKRR